MNPKNEEICACLDSIWHDGFAMGYSWQSNLCILTIQ